MEWLDVVDKKGNPTGKIVERSRAHMEGIWHRTSHVWLIRIKNGQIEVLLQKRSQNKDAYPGCYDTSSAGHIPAGSGYEESAVRELNEELGIQVSPEELHFCGIREVCHDEIFYGIPFCDRQISRIYYLWCSKDAEDFSIQKEEVESVRWMELHDCMHMILHHTENNCIALEEIKIVAEALKDQ